MFIRQQPAQPFLLLITASHGTIELVSAPGSKLRNPNLNVFKTSITAGGNMQK